MKKYGLILSLIGFLISSCSVKLQEANAGKLRNDNKDKRVESVLLYKNYVRESMKPKIEEMVVSFVNDLENIRKNPVKFYSPDNSNTTDDDITNKDLNLNKDKFIKKVLKKW